MPIQRHYDDSAHNHQHTRIFNAELVQELTQTLYTSQPIISTTTIQGHYFREIQNQSAHDCYAVRLFMEQVT